MAKPGTGTEKKPASARKTAHVRFACQKFKQGHFDLFLFLTSAKQLWEIVEVNQLNPDKDEGYQRVASLSRVNRIAEFIDAKNPLPASVLISFDDASVAKNDTELVVPNVPDAGWIIDGQHRLAGAHRAKSDIEIPVVAMVGLAPEDQVQLFVTINREQVGVPTSLYYELLKKLPGKKTDAEMVQERAADLASRLKRDEGSPFFNRIVTITSPKRGELSLTNFVRKVGPLVKRDGRLHIYSDDDRCGILNNYYRAVEHVFPKEFKRADSVFFKTIGFGALMNVFPQFFDMTLNKYHRFRVSDAVNIFKAIAHFDFTAWHQIGTGTAAENVAAEDLRQQLTDALKTKVIDAAIEL